MKINKVIFLINQINLHYKLKKKTIKFKFFFFQINLLKYLVRINYIKYYQIKKKKTIIYLWSNNNYLNIKFFSSASHKIYYSTKQIKKITKYEFGSIYLLNTTKGLITNIEASKNNIGGIIICKFFN